MNKAGVSFIRGDNDVVMKNNFVKEIKGKDVYWEAHPPFLVSRLLGVAPMDSMFLLTKGLAGFTVAFLMFNIYLGVHLSITMERANNMFEMSGFSLILERAQLAIIICSVVVSGLKAIFNVKTLYGVMRQLAYLDRKLYEIGINVPYSRLYGYLLTSARLALIMSLFLPDLFVFKSWRNMDFLVVQYILIMPLLVGNIVQVQFMVLLELVQRRIRILTDSLKDIGQGSNNVVKPNHLHILVSVHSSLLTICEIVNNLYSPQILLILSSIFIVTTANLYHVIEKMIVFISLKKWNDLNFLAMTTYRIFVRSLEVWTMVTTCVNTQELAKEFNTNLYQVMIDDKTNEIANNRKLRLHISMNRELVFTACGFFTLDYTLVHSMIAAATTYLVILIQFGQPTSAPEKAALENNSTAIN